MADHTPSSGNGLRPHGTNYGSFPIRGYPESTAQTFRAGQLVQLDADGGTNSHRVEVASSLSTGYLGVAAEAASSELDRVLPVYEARQEQRFLGWVKETILSTMVGQTRSFARDSSLAIDYLAVNSTAGDNRVTITAVGLQDIAGGPYNIGDTNGYVEFSFRAPNTAFGRSS